MSVGWKMTATIWQSVPILRVDTTACAIQASLEMELTVQV